MDENIQIFITECEDLLEDMERALLELENSPCDNDLINRVFRAAHTIKGSAGLFGFDEIVAFTHVVENLLDDVRNCLVCVDDKLISLLMNCKDQMVLMVDNIVAGDNGKHIDVADLVVQLKGSSVSLPCTPAAPGEQTCGLFSEEDDEDLVEEQHKIETVLHRYHLSIRLEREIFKKGLDPEIIFCQLSCVGEIVQLEAVLHSLPSLGEMDPSACYLGWELILKTGKTKQEVSELVKFMPGALIKILPAESNPSDYAELMQNLPEPDAAIGKILIDVGAITGKELQHILNIQKESGGLTGELLVSEKIVQPQVIESAVKTQSEGRKQKDREFVRVAAEKLDDLVSLVGELVVGSSKVSQLASTRNDTELEESIEALTTTLESMRETTLGLRMTPVANTFNRFHRVVRDNAKELNKKICLKVVGGETELDKSVVEKIGDPLTHLIRNSMDHGLETPQERLSNNKEEEGTITLTAYHETGSIVIEVKDDGRGLNAEKILAIAKERGLVPENKKMSRSDVYKLIFEPGFSTADSVSNLSGRGVGMDVVRRNIETLKGEVSIFSEPGQGSRIVIRLPLTLAIIDGFHVDVSGESFIIPLDVTVECICLSREQKDEASKHDFITLRNEILPIVHLSKSWGGVTNRHGAADVRENLVVVKSDGKKIGMLVDTLHGEVQAVIKPLGKVFGGLSGFAGFTLLGGGQVAMIMDVSDLARSVVRDERDQQRIVDRKSRNRVDLNELLC